ncbi:uncharacterized protein UBRO_01635 [Ustilago bromivora]|uniref:Uncharacterized protein n=1 Tax=Ustilago bromivora TaxID=307758 RepID=A0A1K0FZD2_9BASI|nr:uncharacterized protein UBRO_01635 [Ustilago bromivora]SYW79329.1 uncharacterized protein UBRO2_03013 [Ustilago bromivora]
MRTNFAAVVAFSAAALFAASPAQAQIQSLDLTGGGGATSSSSSQQAAPASTSAASAAPSSSLPTNAIPAASGPDAPATSSIAADPIVSPAYAAGTATYIPLPLPTSKSSIDVSALPSSIPPLTGTPSSNFTLPNATATGSFSSIPTLRSQPYQIVFADTSGLPIYKWNLALNSSSEQSKEALCTSQMQFCAAAGCDDPDAKLNNFCETKYMGVACSCSKGASRLQQYQWPVMLADCQGRNTACRDACIKPGQGVADQNKCLDVCSQNFGGTCGKPGQYAANYAVGKKGDKPSYTVVQGGTAQNSALGKNVGKVSVALVATLVSAIVVVAL